MPTEIGGTVRLTGGEPPIHPGIFDILRGLRQMGLQMC
jgi:molybdenum cofactor biosynthesis enzyme MoaA